MELFAPESYWTLSKPFKKVIVNGCGPGGWKFDLVPDTIWGLNVREACDIHDFMYYLGSDNEDKDRADRVLLNNLNRIIEAKTRWKWLKSFRRRRAMVYYLSVKSFGGPAFWRGKNKPAEMRIVKE